MSPSVAGRAVVQSLWKFPTPSAGIGSCLGDLDMNWMDIPIMTTRILQIYGGLHYQENLPIWTASASCWPALSVNASSNASWNILEASHTCNCSIVDTGYEVIYSSRVCILMDSFVHSSMMKSTVAWYIYTQWFIRVLHKSDKACNCMNSSGQIIKIPVKFLFYCIPQ